MSKKIKILAIILIFIMSINISYAISISDKTDFFEINKKEQSVGQTVEMTINLLKIEYEKFKIVLSSNIELEKIYIDENEQDNNIELDKDDSGIIIEIDKQKLDLDKILLYYKIPENIEVGTKLQLNTKIIINENDEEKVIKEENAQITIVKDNNESKEENKKEDNNQISEEQQEGKINNTIQKNDNIQNESLNKSVSMSTSKTLVTETATYKGSNNNYLSSIEIEGVTLTSDFNKEKTTYFATVEGLETITVKAVAEDSNSKVAITGTDLKIGENKILISVTAENDSVRYYRIYVTNN